MKGMNATCSHHTFYSLLFLLFQLHMGLKLTDGVIILGTGKTGTHCQGKEEQSQVWNTTPCWCLPETWGCVQLPSTYCLLSYQTKLKLITSWFVLSKMDRLNEAISKTEWALAKVDVEKTPLLHPESSVPVVPNQIRAPPHAKAFDSTGILCDINQIFLRRNQLRCLIRVRLINLV